MWINRTPLTDLGSGQYLGFAGGLYPDGKNSRPSAHADAGDHTRGRAAVSRVPRQRGLAICSPDSAWECLARAIDAAEPQWDGPPCFSLLMCTWAARLRLFNPFVELPSD